MKKEFKLMPTKACVINGYQFKAGVPEVLSYGKGSESEFTLEQFATFFIGREKTYSTYFKENLVELLKEVLEYRQNGQPDITPAKKDKVQEKTTTLIQD